MSAERDYVRDLIAAARIELDMQRYDGREPTANERAKAKARRQRQTGRRAAAVETAL